MKSVSTRAPRGRPITRDKDRVLQTAVRAYWQEDRADVSVNAVCALAEVSKPSLYRDFGSEDGLTDAVLERYAQMVLEPVEALLSGPQSFEATLDALIHFASFDPQMETGCLFVKMRTTRSRFGPQTRARIAAIEARLLAQYTQFFKQAAARGDGVSGVSAELAASYLHEQLGLAVGQRAQTRSNDAIRDMLSLALSVLRTQP